jgi:hypothetical protein
MREEVVVGINDGCDERRLPLRRVHEVDVAADVTCKEMGNCGLSAVFESHLQGDGELWIECSF